MVFNKVYHAITSICMQLCSSLFLKLFHNLEEYIFVFLKGTDLRQCGLSRCIFSPKQSLIGEQSVHPY